MPFPRNLITDRLHGNVETLLRTLGGGSAARKVLLSEIYSPGASGHASPFLKTLFPSVKLAATIERSLNTALGRGLDHMVGDIARAGHGNASVPGLVPGTMPAATLSMIEGIVESYTTGAGHGVPNTANELAAIIPGVLLPGPKATLQERDDVFFVEADGTENHIEIKTPKPNYDQGRAAKRRILRIHALKHPTVVKAYVGMPYNPNGLYGNYSWPTTKYFLDSNRDLLIGKEFWDHVGNSSDTYDELLDAFSEVAHARKAELLALLEEV